MNKKISFLFIIPYHLPAEITHRNIAEVSSFPLVFRRHRVDVPLAGCVFESSNICTCHIHRVQLVPREERHVMRCGMHTCITHTGTRSACKLYLVRERNIARSKESTLRAQLFPHPNASDIRFPKVGQGSFRRCIST